MTPETETPPQAADREPGWDDDIPPMPKLEHPPGSPGRLKKMAEAAARVANPHTWESIDGIGKDWGTDEEFEAFLEYLRQSRKDTR